jgi:hypothetical protein
VEGPYAYSHRLSLRYVKLIIYHRNSKRSQDSNHGKATAEASEGKLKQTLRVVAEQKHRIVQLEQSLEEAQNTVNDVGKKSPDRRRHHEAQILDDMKHELAKFQAGYHFAAQLCTHLEQQLRDVRASEIRFGGLDISYFEGLGLGNVLHSLLYFSLQLSRSA